MTPLHELPADHPDRNRPLVGAFYSLHGQRFREVFPNFGIAKNTYNELSPVWTDNHRWEFRDD